MGRSSKRPTSVLAVLLAATACQTSSSPAANDLDTRATPPSGSCRLERSESGFVLEHSSWVRAIDFSRDGAQLLVGTESGEVFLWRLDDAEVRPGRLLGFLPGRVRSVRFAPDGLWAVVGTDEPQVVRTLRLDWPPPSTVNGRQRSPSPSRQPGSLNIGGRVGPGSSIVTEDAEWGLSVSADGRWVFAAGKCNVNIYKTAWLGDGLLQDRWNDHNLGGLAARLPSGGPFALSSDGLWTLTAGEQTLTLSRLSLVRAVAVTPHGNTHWGATDIQIDSCPIRGRQVQALALLPDGLRAVGGADDGTVLLWSLDPTGRGGSREIAHLTGHTGAVTAVAVAPDGRWICTASADGTVRLWPLDVVDASSREPLVVRSSLLIGRHDGAVSCLAVSPDGRWISSGGSDKKARVWRVPELRLAPDVRGDDPETRAALARFASWRGWTELLHRDLVEAQRHLDRALELDAANVEALLFRGFLHILLERPDEAFHDLERAVELDPTWRRGALHFCRPSFANTGTTGGTVAGRLLRRFDDRLDR